MPGPPIPFVGPDPHTLDAKQPPALPPLPGRDFQAAPMVAGSALPEEPKANFILEVLGKKADDLFRSCGDGSGHSTAAAKAKSKSPRKYVWEPTIRSRKESASTEAGLIHPSRHPPFSLPVVTGARLEPARVHEAAMTSYMEDLRGFLVDEQRPVTYGFLSSTLSVPADTAKRCVCG